MSGKSYRLLTESEYEYAARAGTRTIYPWGNDVGLNNANCKNGCGSRWDNLGKPLQSVPFASTALAFTTWSEKSGNGLKDCFHENYNEAPSDGYGLVSEVIVRAVSFEVVLGDCHLTLCASSNRDASVAVGRSYSLSFRIARTLHLQSIVRE